MEDVSAKHSSSSELAHAGRDVPAPFRVLLQTEVLGETELVCHEILRLLPGKRIVCRASIGNRIVLAKLFVDAGNAVRHLDREAGGIEAFRRANILTPAVLGRSGIPGDGACLLFEYLENAESLSDCWERAPDDVQRAEVLGRALEVIGSMHKAGLFQSDIHLDNFLLSRDALYCIDGADVDFDGQGQALAADAARQNLGLFFAQLYPCFDHLIPDSLGHYVSAVEGVRSGLDGPSLVAETSLQRDRRQQHFLKKTYRECSAFVCEHSWRRFMVFDRDYDTPAFRDLLGDPDGALLKGESLKKGNTATVGLVEIDGHRLVLKRYNIKNFWHGVQRAFQPTRASISWRNGHMLGFLGIPTPKPVAIVEERFGPLRSRAFLLAESVAGDHALDYFTDAEHPADEQNRLGCHIIEILESLYQARISHGDLKATNILVEPDGPQLIDLDAMKQHSSEKEFRRAFVKDLDRFMKNWQNSASALDQFSPEVESLRERLEKL